jgi:hypothetical protein
LLPGTELKFNRHSANTGAVVSTGAKSYGSAPIPMEGLVDVKSIFTLRLHDPGSRL